VKRVDFFVFEEEAEQEEEMAVAAG